MLPTINCDITKGATNVTIYVSLIHKKWRRYLVTLKDFLKISYYKIQLLSKICILLQDTVTSKGKYFITRYCLQDTKIRYCPSLVTIALDTNTY